MKTEDYALLLYVIRHAQSLSNAVHDDGAELSGITFDAQDPPLSPLGERQAAALGQRFAAFPLDAVRCSPCVRARQTASFLTAQQTHASFTIDNALLEVGEAIRTNGRIVNVAEPPDASLARAADVLQALRQAYTNGESVALVTHATFTSFLLRAALDIPFREDRRVCMYNAAITKIKFYRDGTTKLAFHNDTGHLIAAEGDHIFSI